MSIGTKYFDIGFATEGEAQKKEAVFEKTEVFDIQLVGVYKNVLWDVFYQNYQGLYIVDFDLLSDLRGDDFSKGNPRSVLIAPYKKKTKILKTKPLTVKERNQITELLSKQIAVKNHMGGALCHYPIHGIRIFKDGKIIHNEDSTDLEELSTTKLNIWFSFNFLDLVLNLELQSYGNKC